MSFPLIRPRHLNNDNDSDSELFPGLLVSPPFTVASYFPQVRRHEKQRCGRDSAAAAEAPPRRGGTGPDSGFGSDSARIRIVQIEQQSGASHHRLARPSHKSTITKNLSFIPFDVFLTAGRLSVMTYACSGPPKAPPSSSDTPGTPEKKDPGEKVKEGHGGGTLGH